MEVQLEPHQDVALSIGPMFLSSLHFATPAEARTTFDNYVGTLGDKVTHRGKAKEGIKLAGGGGGIK